MIQFCYGLVLNTQQLFFFCHLEAEITGLWHHI